MRICVNVSMQFMDLLHFLLHLYCISCSFTSSKFPSSSPASLACPCHHLQPPLPTAPWSIVLTRIPIGHGELTDRLSCPHASTLRQSTTIQVDRGTLETLCGAWCAHRRLLCGGKYTLVLQSSSCYHLFVSPMRTRTSSARSPNRLVLPESYCLKL